MKKIENNFDESIYHFVTNSGLNTYYLYRPGFKKSTAVMGVPFGSLNLEQKNNGETIHHPQGSAHFLEHKLFEDEKEDILSTFTKMGASANAFTSHDETMYYFNHNSDLIEPLNTLLSFVRRFDIKETSVEKEKPIIVEEIKMYEQMPDMKLIMETYKNLFHSFPLLYDIAGTESSVNNTTLEDLKTAYALNYHDERLVLVIIGPNDPEEIQKLVMNHPMHSKHALGKLEDIFEEEKLDVVHKDRIIEANIETDKMSYSFKFPYTGTSKFKDRFILRRILEMNFSEMNPLYQHWLDDDVISDFFSYDVELRDGFGVFYFFNQGDTHEEFKAMIRNQLKNLIMDENDFDQIMKRHYGETILSLSQFDSLAFAIARSHFDNDLYFDRLETIKDLEFRDILTYKHYFMDLKETFLLLKKAS